MDPSAVAVIIGALAAGWCVQIYLAMKQAKAFQASVRTLRTVGRTAVGRGGSRYRGVAFCALAEDRGGRVARASVLRGVTVFSRPRPAPELVGRSLAELTEKDSNSSLDLAIADAARHLLNAATAKDKGG
ncbi:MAG: transcriptional regulator GutM [Actinomycetota bacterium]